MTDLANKVLKGDRLALSRLITHIENDFQDHHTILDQLFPHTGKAHIIGVTGPSGSGKSTLVNRLALNMVGVKMANNLTGSALSQWIQPALSAAARCWVTACVCVI